MDKVGIEDNVLIVPSRRLEKVDPQRIQLSLTITMEGFSAIKDAILAILHLLLEVIR